MKNITVSIVLALVLISSSVHAKKDNLTHGQRVSIFVNEYFIQNNNAPFYEECNPSKNGCVDAVCNHLGKYACDERNEVDEVMLWCRGNYDGGCVSESCKFLGRYACDEDPEAKEIARACVGNRGGECVSSVCTRLGRYSCDERNEVLEVIRKCAGN